MKLPTSVMISVFTENYLKLPIITILLECNHVTLTVVKPISLKNCENISKLIFCCIYYVNQIFLIFDILKDLRY